MSEIPAELKTGGVVGAIVMVVALGLRHLLGLRTYADSKLEQEIRRLEASMREELRREVRRYRRQLKVAEHRADALAKQVELLAGLVRELAHTTGHTHILALIPDPHAIPPLPNDDDDDDIEGAPA